MGCAGGGAGALTVPGGIANGAGAPLPTDVGGATGADNGLGVVTFAGGMPLVGSVGGGGAGAAAGFPAIFMYKNNAEKTRYILIGP